jgi:hypothetical protein
MNNTPKNIILRKAYETLQSSYLKPGDIVEVLNPYTINSPSDTSDISKKLGWSTDWIPEMDVTIGHRFIVEGIHIIDSPETLSNAPFGHRRSYVNGVTLCEDPIWYSERGIFTHTTETILAAVKCYFPIWCLKKIELEETTSVCSSNNYTSLLVPKLISEVIAEDVRKEEDSVFGAVLQDLSIKEAYSILLESYIHAGDSVKIVTKVPDEYLGAKACWIPNMDEAIGRFAIVDRVDIHNARVWLKPNLDITDKRSIFADESLVKWSYPLWSLEVNPKIPTHAELSEAFIKTVGMPADDYYDHNDSIDNTYNNYGESKLFSD